MLELQYVAIQELMNELGRMPSREEVTTRVEAYITEGNKVVFLN